MVLTVSSETTVTLRTPGCGGREVPQPDEDGADPAPGKGLPEVSRSSGAEAADLQRYGYEALWSRISSADYSEVAAGQLPPRQVPRLDHMNTNNWKQAR